jgi:hypothetical protein
MAPFGNWRGPATILSLALFTTSLAAQSMTVSPGGSLTGGEKAEISYENRAKAGQTVVVTVSGGTPLVTVEIPVQLDSAGKGKGTWLVIGAWWTANFNAPDVKEVSCGIK